MPQHRKPPNRRAAFAVALVVAAAVFAVVLGFGGNSKSPKPAADSTPRTSAPVTSTPATSAPSSSATSSAPPTTKPTTSAPAKPTPTSTSTGVGTQDASITALNDKVHNQPVRIRIPSLGVDAGIIPVGVDGTGALEVPSNVVQAAWYQAGATPGDAGTAIIAAHVDFNGSLGLFNKLHTLPRGAEIDVVDASGKTRVFHATTGSLAPKSDPSTVQSLAAASAVKGQPRLALITCGGDLDTVKHSYYDNYVLLAAE
jgi:sortase (surface protein transpeptidase)